MANVSNTLNTSFSMQATVLVCRGQFLIFVKQKDVSDASNSTFERVNHN